MSTLIKTYDFEYQHADRLNGGAGKIDPDDSTLIHLCTFIITKLTTRSHLIDTVGVLALFRYGTAIIIVTRKSSVYGFSDPPFHKAQKGTPAGMYLRVLWCRVRREAKISYWSATYDCRQTVDHQPSQHLWSAGDIAAFIVEENIGVNVNQLTKEGKMSQQFWCGPVLVQIQRTVSLFSSEEQYWWIPRAIKSSPLTVLWWNAEKWLLAQLATKPAVSKQNNCWIRIVIVPVYYCWIKSVWRNRIGGLPGRSAGCNLPVNPEYAHCEAPMAICGAGSASRSRCSIFVALQKATRPAEAQGNAVPYFYVAINFEATWRHLFFITFVLQPRARRLYFKCQKWWSYDRSRKHHL